MGLTPESFPAVSVPPATRAEALLDRTQAAADKDFRMLIVSSFTDWLAIACMTLLIGMGALGPDFGWSIPALASGTIYAKMRGAKGVAGGGSTTAALLLGGPFALKALATVIGRTVLGAALLLLVGCGAGIPPALVQDARQRLAEAAAPLPDATAKMNATGAALAKLCPVPPALTVLPLDTCRTLVDGFNASAEVIGVVQPALRFADTVLATVEAGQ